MIATALVSPARVKSNGRTYRPLFCPSCNDIRYHAIDFISGERNEHGVFVWFKRKCTGVEAHDTAKHRRLRLVKNCGREEIADMSYSQWTTFAEGQYY